MSPGFIFFIVSLYSILLFAVTWVTSRGATNETYFVGNRSSKWYIVAYGMIGASLSGVTFMSVPGWVGTTHFFYMQMVMGYLAGYTVIATILLPLYYRLNLTSIYTYLLSRFGSKSYSTGAFFFILSRTIGASFRLYIVVNVLQVFIFDAWNIPFFVTTLAFIVLILLYTFQGGVKTIVYTDTLQTTFMLGAVILTVFMIGNELNLSVSALISETANSPFSDMFDWNWKNKTFFPKQFFGGMFIAIAMTGLDQEMMQKNISVKTLGDSKKNMFSFALVLFFINLLFLFLGAVLYYFSTIKGLAIPLKTDDLFPNIALHHLGTVSAVIFIVGLISAAYPSADGALTALTTSFCLDILRMRDRKNWDEARQKNVRYLVHFSFAALLLGVIVLFRMINNDAVISHVFKAANFTYGPLLGLYSFGLFSKRKVNDGWVPWVCISSPVLCYFLNEFSASLFNGYVFGNELLILNGALTFLLLYQISKKPSVE